MTDFGRRSGGGDMLKTVYDPNNDGVIATAQTEADMTKAVYDPTDDGVVDSVPAHKTSHQDAGSDEVAATGLVGRVNYVDRGDPSSIDKTLADFTCDGNWNDLDLSGIVPAGALAIHINVFVEDDAASSILQFRPNGNSQARNMLETRVQVAGVRQHVDGFVSCDSNRKIEYRTSATVYDNIGLVVRGWLI